MASNVTSVTTPKTTNLVDILCAQTSTPTTPTVETAPVVTQPTPSDKVVIGEVVKEPAPTAQAAAKEVTDPVAKQPKQKKGFVQSLKDFVRAVRKFFINVSEYGKGTAKGVFSGGIVGALVFGATHAVLSIKKFVKNRSGNIAKGIEEGIETAGKKAPKALKKTKLPLVLGIISGAFVLVKNLWDASLIANEKKADVDHRYTTTPVIDHK